MAVIGQPKVCNFLLWFVQELKVIVNDVFLIVYYTTRVECNTLIEKETFTHA